MALHQDDQNLTPFKRQIGVSMASDILLSLPKVSNAIETPERRYFGVGIQTNTINETRISCKLQQNYFQDE